MEFHLQTRRDPPPRVEPGTQHIARPWVAPLLLSTLLALSLQPRSVAADTIIDTTAIHPDGGIIALLPARPQVGQVITVPTSDSVLNSFSVRMSGGDIFDFNANVAAWDGVQPVGPLVFSTTQTTLPDDHIFKFNAGGLALTPGHQYILFLDASFFSAPLGQVLPLVSTDPYTGGSLVFSPESDWSANAWDTSLASFDLSFSAEFSAPSPATVPLPSSVPAAIALFALTRLQLRRR